MSQYVPPGDITTQPGTKVVFNSPYDDKHTYHIKVSDAYHLRSIEVTVGNRYCRSIMLL